MAKQARYHGDKLAMFNAIKSATEAKYKLDVADETALGVRTKGKWYSEDGGVIPQGADDNIELVPDRSIRVALIVRMLADGDSWIVEVTPDMVRNIKGRPNPDRLAPDDPSVPGWATGQAEQLQYDIYSALKPYEVKTAAGMPSSPSPSPSAEAAPAAPVDQAPAPDPAAGSAAPTPTPDPTTTP